MKSELIYYDGSKIKEMLVYPYGERSPYHGDDRMEIVIFTDKHEYYTSVTDGILRDLWGHCWGDIFKETDENLSHKKLFGYVRSTYLKTIPCIHTTDAMLKELFFGENTNE